MTTSLGKVGIVDRGNYLQEETYNAGDFVLYNGSTWLALKDGLLGAEPAEGTNWKYLARGFEAEVLSMIVANDTSGLIGEAGQQVNAQNLIDVIADKVATKLIEKGSIVNNAVTTVEGTVLDGRMGKALQDQITAQNKNINSIIEVIRVDILNYIKTNFISMKSRTIRGFECSNAPVEGGNDFIYYIDTINDINFTSVIAIDVRTNCVYRNNMIGGKWIGWDKFILNSDLYALHTPIEGTIITNIVPSKVNTTVNSLTLEAGIYIVMANATYDSSFSGYLTNHYLTQDGKFIVTCRNSGDAGSGQCPCWIIKSTSKTTVSLGLYQGSNETRTLNKNSLIATRLA